MTDFKEAPCTDCGDVKQPDQWGYFQYRCMPCHGRFHTALHAKRLADAETERLAHAVHVANGCPDDGLVCPSCCDHEFDTEEGGYCIHDCGVNGYEYGA